MQIQNAMRIGKAWDKLGWAVQAQAEQVIETGIDEADCNVNALVLIAEFLRVCKREGVEGAEEILEEISAVV